MVTQDGFIFRIPDTYKGNHLEIAAVGEYENQIATMRTYLREKYSDAQSELISESDCWMLNGEKIETDSIEIATGNINTIRYYYDKTKYFFVESNPKALNAHPDQDGYVEFVRADSQVSSVDYEVVLREC